MERRRAKALASTGPTVEALRAAIRQHRRLAKQGEISRVNKNLTVEQACDILKAAIKDRAPSACMRTSGPDLRITTNILWECV